MLSLLSRLSGTLLVKPVVRPFHDVFLLVAVALLYAPEELVIVSFGLRHIVIRQFAPLTFGLSLELSPLPFELFCVHVSLLNCPIVARINNHSFYLTLRAFPRHLDNPLGSSLFRSRL